MALALAASTSPQHVKAADLLKVGFRIPMELFYLAEGPSGTMLCDRTLRKRQTAAFDKRYGTRFNRLIRAVIQTRQGLGWPDDQIITTPCYRTSATRAKQLLDQFDKPSGEYERKYGLAVSFR